MPRGNESYFGIKLGEAIAAGAGHISDALRRKYEMQREEEQRLKSEQLAFAQQGVALPGQPMTGYPQETLSPLIRAHQEKVALERRKTEAEIKRTQFQTTPAGQYGGMGAGGGYNFLTGPGGAQYVPTKYGPKFVPGTGAPPNKPLNQFQTNAAAGVMAAKKLESMLESARGEPIGRIFGLGGTLSQKNIAGKILRIGDSTAQEFAAAKDEIVDLLARIRTGAVITASEEKLYANKLYSILQDEEINKKNIRMIRDYFQRALPKGYNPETSSYEEETSGNSDFESGLTPLFLTREKIAEMEAAIARGE